MGLFFILQIFLELFFKNFINTLIYSKKNLFIFHHKIY